MTARTRSGSGPSSGRSAGATPGSVAASSFRELATRRTSGVLLGVMADPLQLGLDGLQLPPGGQGPAGVGLDDGLGHLEGGRPQPVPLLVGEVSPRDHPCTLPRRPHHATGSGVATGLPQPSGTVALSRLASRRGGRMIQFHALGGLTITEHGEEIAIGGARQRRLLAMLLIHRNAVVSVDRLADAVFAGEPTPAASTTLRSYIARIRKVVDGVDPAPRVVTQAPGYLLRLPPEAFDVARFEEPPRRRPLPIGPRGPRRGRGARCARGWRCGGGRPTRSSPTRTGPGPRPNASASCASWPTRASSTPSWPVVGRPS